MKIGRLLGTRLRPPSRPAFVGPTPEGLVRRDDPLFYRSHSQTTTCGMVFQDRLRSQNTAVTECRTQPMEWRAFRDYTAEASRLLPGCRMSRKVCWAYFTLIFCCTTTASNAAPFVLQSDQLKPKQPQLAVNSDNAVHLVFGSDSQIYHCVSTNLGETFSAPVLVGEMKFLSLGMRRGPRVAVAKDTITVTAIGGELGGGRDGDLFAWRSPDGGKTWLDSTRVNDANASAREGLHAMAAGPKGELYCVWLDLRNKRTEIMGSRSDDGGKTWSKNNLVYRSPDKNVCECCHPSVTFADDGGLFVMWRNSIEGNRDMYWAKSNDSGKNFGDAERLGEGSWKLAACPMDGGAIAVDGAGKVHAAWRRKGEVYLTENKPTSEVKLGDGEQPWIAPAKNGVIATWITRRPGDLMLMLPGGSKPLQIAKGARDPVVIGVNDMAIVAWDADQNGRAVIKVDCRAIGSRTPR